MAEIIRMPKMSDTMEEGVIASWLKKVGDDIKSGDILAEVETDKATMELESYDDGVLLHVGVKDGDSVPVDGVIAIIGGVEIIAAIALLPAVINSFLFLSSVKRVVEHRQIKGKPVEHTDDFKLKATNDKTVPVTLVRLILAGGPLTEKQVGFAIFKLAIFSGALAIITAFMMGTSL